MSCIAGKAAYFTRDFWHVHVSQGSRIAHLGQATRKPRQPCMMTKQLEPWSVILPSSSMQSTLSITAVKIPRMLVQCSSKNPMVVSWQGRELITKNEIGYNNLGDRSGVRTAQSAKPNFSNEEQGAGSSTVGGNYYSQIASATPARLLLPPQIKPSPEFR